MTINQPKNLDDVLKWYTHQAYCFDVVALSNGDVPLTVGDKIVGKLAWWTGAVWKILDDGDVISATSLIAPILYDRILTADAAADAAAFLPKVPILRRGPALVHKDGIEYDAGVVQATVNSAMLAQGIKIVDEVGLHFSV